MALVNKEPYDYYERVDIDATAHLTIKSGVVYLRLFGATVTNGFIDITIPAAYRPRESFHFIASQQVPNGSTTNFYAGLCSVGASDGLITIYALNNGSATKMGGIVYGTATWIL